MTDLLERLFKEFMEAKNGFLRKILTELIAREPEPDDMRKVTLAYFESEKEFAVDRFHFIYNNKDYGVVEIVYPNMVTRGSMVFKSHLVPVQWPPDPVTIEQPYCDVKTRKHYNTERGRLAQCSCGYMGVVTNLDGLCPGCNMSCGMRYI